MSAQPNLNPNNRKAQQVYSGETSYLAYVVEIQEINLRSERVLSDDQPPLPPREVEEEREEKILKVCPPFLERLTQPLQPTPEETEFFGELKNLCVKIPVLQAIKDVSIYNNLIKEKCFKHLGRQRRDSPTINVIGQLFDVMLG